MRSGLVSVDSDGDLNVVGRLNRLVTAPGGAHVDVNHLLFRAASPSELGWSDFDHVARDRDHVVDVLRGALEAGATGVNILLYGPPGTGKTELCKVLAGHLGVTLYSVGESDEEGGEPLRGERLQELRLAQRLLGGDRRSLLLFDEMDDLLSSAWPNFDPFGLSFAPRSRNGSSKVFMHRLLEQAPRAHSLDHERCPAPELRHPAPDDVRPGAASSDDAGQREDLDAAARAPRHRGASA